LPLGKYSKLSVRFALKKAGGEIPMHPASFDTYHQPFRTMLSKVASLLLLTPEP